MVRPTSRPFLKVDSEAVLLRVQPSTTRPAVTRVRGVGRAVSRPRLAPEAKRKRVRPPKPLLPPPISPEWWLGRGGLGRAKAGAPCCAAAEQPIQRAVVRDAVPLTRWQRIAGRSPLPTPPPTLPLQVLEGGGRGGGMNGSGFTLVTAARGLKPLGPSLSRQLSSHRGTISLRRTLWPVCSTIHPRLLWPPEVG